MPLENECANSATWKWNRLTSIHAKNENLGTITALDISPSGKSISTANSLGEIKVWDFIDPKNSIAIKMNGRVGRIKKLCFVDEKLLLIYSRDKIIRLWSLQNDQEIFQLSGHTSPVEILEISSCKRFICSVDRSGVVKAWNAKNGKQIITVNPKKNPFIKGISFSSQSRSITVLCSNGSVASIDLAEQKFKSKFCVEFSFRITAFSRDGRFLACSRSNHSITVVDLESGETVASLQGHTKPISALAFSEDGDLIASASYDKAILVWDIHQQRLVRNLTSEQRKLVTLLRFSVDDRLLIAADPNDNVELWWCTRTVHIINKVRVPIYKKFIKAYNLFLYGAMPFIFMLIHGLILGLYYWALVLFFNFVVNVIIRQLFSKSPSYSTKYSERLKARNLSLEDYDSDLLLHFPTPDCNEGSSNSSRLIEEIKKEDKKQRKHESFERKKEALGYVSRLAGSILVSGLFGMASDQATDVFGGLFGYQKVSGHTRSSGTRVEEYWRRKPKG